MNSIADFLPRIIKSDQSSLLLLPVRNIVLLPGITLPLVAGKPRSVAVGEAALLNPNKQLIVATVRPEVDRRFTEDFNAEIEKLEEIYPIATLAVVQRMMRLAKGTIQLLVRGLERVRIDQLEIINNTYEAKFHRLPKLNLETALARGTSAATIEALTGAIQSLWQEFATISPNFPEELLAVLLQANEPAELAYQTHMLLEHDVTKIQAVLEEENLEKLLRETLAEFSQELEVQRLRGKILGETKKEIDKEQREFFLRRQLSEIYQELGEIEPETKEVEELRSRLVEAQLPETAHKQAEREISRLERVGNNSAEGGVIRTYVDLLLEMPWNKTVQDNLDLQNAREVLDNDHYGLVKVKDRIIEHLATLKLKQSAWGERSDRSSSENISKPPEEYTVGTVLCFAGAPGVGKTSLGRSIARALGRPFERISLGGLRDEAELRGHRRTYIGAMPGRVVQALHRVGVKNPVIMLDELDKVGMDYRGDPASVLLEILDPQQNYCFRDLYLDLEFDLSQIFFIGTANNLANVPAPLLDRLEIIELSGYSDQEKLAIALKYLLPRQLQKAGLPNDAVQLPSETLRRIIELYTREAGVRRLEQQIGTLCRKVALRYANGDTNPVTIQPEQLEELLGAKQFLRDEMRKAPRSGVATGLAWTTTGGEVLFVETALLPEGKNLTLTGHLGKVMEESARIAYSYIWSNAVNLGIDASVFKDNGIHIHVPSGAIPKDGPSAGITMTVAIASLLMKQPVRTDTAMTGEINLSGEVLAIGGVREKVLAACRTGIKRVILPKENEKDLVDLPNDVCTDLEFVFCDRIEQVLENVLVDRVVLNT
jgi:ATP-dependent Lon protease